MGVRNEVVRLSLQDAGFGSGAAQATAQAIMLAKAVDSIDHAAVRTKKSVPAASREVDGLGRTSKAAGPEIDRLSGRMRILADVAAVVGPSVAPIGAIAVPALTGLASQLGFAVVGMGSLIVAAQGVGDALKTVNEAALDPTAENLEKAQEAMAALGPDAQLFVARFQELRPVLKDIRDAAAAGWFPGLTESLDDLDRIAPLLANILQSVGETGGELVAQGADFLSGPEGREFLKFVEDNASQALEELGQTVGNVALGLARLWKAFDPLNDDFSTWLLEASRSFADWADGLSETEGFEEFVAYIRENGPQVAATLKELAIAAVEIVEAIAPLGGPSLKIIEVFAKALSAIADSDLGTPILAGVAALALYNRTLQATTALQTKLGLTGAASGAAGIGLFGRPGAAGAGQAVSPLRASVNGLRADLSAMSAVYATAGARTERETERLSRTAASARQNLAGIAKGASPAAVALGTLTAASTDAGEGLGATNAAMGLMLGQLGGPWGMAAGATAGAILDIVEALKAVDKVLESGDQRAASDAFQARLDGIWNPLNQPSILGSDAVSLIKDGETATEKLGKQAGSWQSAGSLGDMGIKTLADARKYQADYARSVRESEAASLGLTAASSSLAAQYGVSNRELAESIELIDKRTSAALGAFGAETQWRNALKSAQEQAGKTNAGIEGSSKAALENRAQLENLASAWGNQRDRMEEAGRSAGSIDKKYRQARRAFIQTATAMGVPIERARELARNLLAIPEARATRVTLNVVGMAALKGLKSVMDTITDKTVRVTAIGSNPAAVGADGMTVPGDRSGPYGDKVFSFLAPGEEVISNRHGQADRWRPLLKAINANAYADGGTVATRASSVPSLPWAGLPALNVTTMKLGDLNRALAASTAALTKEKDQREAIVSKMTDLRSTVASNGMSDLFGQTNPWSNGGSVADVTGVINGDRVDLRNRRDEIAKLKAKGLDGPALAALLAEADDATISNFAASSKSELAQYETAFNRRTALANQTGQAAANAAYGAELRRSTSELKQLNRRVDRLTKVTQAEARESRRAAKRGASAGGRNRKRG